MSVITSKKEYAVYKGESFICIGTIQACAHHMGVLPATVRYCLSKKVSKAEEGKKLRNCYGTRGG
ncbi:hypothetical protein KOW_03518 [Bacillus cereus VDM006]|nr:hypothetical protein KOW_03518 [Bacillus cereus VDM006]